MHKIFPILIAMLLICSFDFSVEKELRVWVFSEKLVNNSAIARFEIQNPAVKVEVTFIPYEDFFDKIRSVFISGNAVPDLFLGEFNYINELEDSVIGENQSTKYPYNNLKYMMPYQVQMMTNLKRYYSEALFWEITPGGFYYNKSLAQQYLYTDDPIKIDEMINTPDKFLEIARKLNNASGGYLKIITGINNLPESLFAYNKKGFVNRSGELVIDSSLLKIFDVAKILSEENLIRKGNTVSLPWIGPIEKEKKVFGYSLSALGIHYPITLLVRDNEGDYSLTNSPGSFFWGGIWLSIYKNSKQKDLARKFIKMISDDKDTARAWTMMASEIINNQPQSIKIDFSIPDAAIPNSNLSEIPTIHAAIVNKYERPLKDFFLNAVNGYANGKIKKDEAVAFFKEQVKSAFPDIIVR